jgi:hypothetical protein
MMTGIGMPIAQSRMPRMLESPGHVRGPWPLNAAAAEAVPAEIQLGRDVPPMREGEDAWSAPNFPASTARTLNA